jgi:hypothetical protein
MAFALRFSAGILDDLPATLRLALAAIHTCLSRDAFEGSKEMSLGLPFSVWKNPGRLRGGFARLQYVYHFAGQRNGAPLVVLRA